MVAQAGSESSFIEPDRSTTNTMSRGLAMPMAEAVVSKRLRPKTRAKNSGALVRRAVTRTALPPAVTGVNVPASEFQTPISTSLVVK